MKFIIIIGGITGFGIGMLFGWATQSPWPAVMWRSCAAAYAGGLLMRWWGRLWLKSLQEAQIQRRQAELATLATAGEDLVNPDKA